MELRGVFGGPKLGNKFPIEVNILIDNFGELNMGNKVPFEGNILMNNSGGRSFVDYRGGENLGKTEERPNFVN